MIGRLAAICAAIVVAACAPAGEPDSAGAGAGSDWTSLDGRVLPRADIDALAARLMTANDVKGLALALIAGGEVREVAAYGFRSVEGGLPLQTDTVMYGASLTKATFAWFVMQLVDEGLVDLDRPIADYLPQPLPAYEDYADLAGDERWRKLTFRMLLSHTPGFANFRFFDKDGDFNPDGKLAIYFEPGSRYAYSGEGMKLAQRVLERGLGLDVAAEMQRRIFNPLGMRRTFLICCDGFEDNLTAGYAIDSARIGHDQNDEFGAPGSMETTIDDWSRFLAGVVRGDGLSEAAKAEMIRTQIRIRFETQFPTLRETETDAWDPIALGYGIGWGVFDSPFGRAFFKEGHDDGTANYALCIESRQTCILLMSNSVRAEGIFNELVETLLGDVALPWRWEGYEPYDLAGDVR